MYVQVETQAWKRPKNIWSLHVKPILCTQPTAMEKQTNEKITNPGERKESGFKSDVLHANTQLKKKNQVTQINSTVWHSQRKNQINTDRP